ncbi:MAG TPA: RNA methyltransferase, partial [Puia sp.]
MVSNFPPELIRSLAKQDHFNPETFLAVHDSGEQLVSVHMNPEKPVFPSVNELENNGEVPFEIAGRVPWAPDAWYLSSRPAFTLDPLFHAGTYYVQEPSGMFVAFALEKITDLSKKINV